MRSVGTRRGNTMVRFVVDQASRRRLWISLAPGLDDAGPSGADQWSVRWSRRFYDHVRRRLVPRMTAVARSDAGELRWYGRDGFAMWALVDVHATVLALDHADTPSQLVERARRWAACLTTRTAPGPASAHWGHPVYGARLDTRSGELDVVWAVPGDWCGLVMSASLPATASARPGHWASPEPALV